MSFQKVSATYCAAAAGEEVGISLLRNCRLCACFCVHHAAEALDERELMPFCLPGDGSEDGSFRVTLVLPSTMVLSPKSSSPESDTVSA